MNREPSCRSLSLVALLMSFTLFGCKTIATKTPVDITFSHTGSSPTTIGTVYAEHGQLVRIRVTDTETDCYAFNAKVIEQPTPASGAELFTDSVVFETTMWDDPLEITIEARKLSTADECKPGGERIEGGSIPPWKVRVLRQGWDIAFAGAYTADTVTNPVYALVEGEKQVNPEPAPKTKGFFIKSFQDQEDAYRLGAAAAVHVTHTGLSSFAWRDIGWAPVTFALGVGEASQVRYFLGTSLQFGKKFYLTAGGVVGSVKTLPAGLVADSTTDPAGFTTNANALSASNLGNRTETGFFIGVSYTFASVGASSFNGPFAAVKPAPVGEDQNGGDQQDTQGTLKITMDPPTITQALTQKVVKYKFVIKNASDGMPLEKAHFKHQPYSPDATSTATCAAQGTGAKCPTGALTGNIDVEIDLPKDTTYTFEVTTTFTADAPTPKKLTASVEHPKLQPALTKEINIP